MDSRAIPIGTSTTFQVKAYLDSVFTSTPRTRDLGVIEGSDLDLIFAEARRRLGPFGLDYSIDITPLEVLQ